MWPTEEDAKLDEFGMMELPGQQLRAAFAHTPLQQVLQLNLHAPPSCLRMTAIAATMGKSTKDPKLLMKMMASGMNIAVLNMNYGSRDEHIEMITVLRKIMKEYSVQVEKNFPLAIAVKLSGRKIRTGRIADTYGDSVELRAGENIRLTTDETYKEKCSMYTIFIDFLKFAEQVRKGEFIYIDNELIVLRVDTVALSTITCKVEKGGILESFKDVLVPGVNFDMPLFSDKDKKDIDMCIRQQVDIVIASSVNTSENIKELRTLLGEKGKRVNIIANIQTYSEFHDYDNILKVADAVMINRQELGTDINPNKLIIAQKNMIARANQANIPVFLNTHILNSMRTNETPSRSELQDIANAVLDGIDGFLLCPETAVGAYPVKAVQDLSNACKETESCMWTKQLFYDLVDVTEIPCKQSDCIAMSAVLASQRAVAAAIIAVTSTGEIARRLSMYKPRCPIIAVTRYFFIAKKLHMWRGILPLHYEDIVIASSVNTSENIKELRTLLGEKGKRVNIIANIQTYSEFHDYDNILKVADAVMINRQELGTDINPNKLIIAQKNMIARANKANIPVFLNTHILNSMRTNETPSRSELQDIANAVLDGIDGFLLCPETAVGAYPVKAVQDLSNACKETESCMWTKQLFYDLVDVTEIPCKQSDCIAMSAVLASQRAVAAAIIAVTSTGEIARRLSMYKPRCPIIAVTRYFFIAKKLHMWRGILPLHYEGVPDSDWQTDADNRVDFCIKFGVDRGFIRIGDPVIVVSGWRQGPHVSSTMRLVYTTTPT